MFEDKSSVSKSVSARSVVKAIGSCSEIVLSNQGGDERWSDPFQVDRELADCDIAGQVFLMHSPEGPQKVA
jgi:hypothetical protein